METWPAQLQTLLNQESFNFSFGDTNVRSDVDVGLPKVRSRYTKAIDSVSATIRIDYDDFITVQDFYRTTLINGTQTFAYNHPLTGEAAEWRFIEPPNIEPMGGRVFQVTMKWEKIP